MATSRDEYLSFYRCHLDLYKNWFGTCLLHHICELEEEEEEEREESNVEIMSLPKNRSFWTLDLSILYSMFRLTSDYMVDTYDHSFSVFCRCARHVFEAPWRIRSIRQLQCVNQYHHNQNVAMGLTEPRRLFDIVRFLCRYLGVTLPSPPPDQNVRELYPNADETIDAIGALLGFGLPSSSSSSSSLWGVICMLNYDHATLSNDVCAQWVNRSVRRLNILSTLDGFDPSLYYHILWHDSIMRVRHDTSCCPRSDDEEDAQDAAMVLYLLTLANGNDNGNCVQNTNGNGVQLASKTHEHRVRLLRRAVRTGRVLLLRVLLSDQAMSPSVVIEADVLADAVMQRDQQIVAVLLQHMEREFHRPYRRTHADRPPSWWPAWQARCDMALDLALRHASLRVIDRLLPHVDPSKNDHRALLVACASGHVKSVNRLLRDGRVNPAARGGVAMRVAIAGGHIAIVKRLAKAAGMRK